MYGNGHRNNSGVRPCNEEPDLGADDSFSRPCMRFSTILSVNGQLSCTILFIIDVES